MNVYQCYQVFIRNWKKLYEAQRFLEKVNKCNGICGNPLNTTYNGCGC